jgi:hypothetical protein
MCAPKTRSFHRRVPPQHWRRYQDAAQALARLAGARKATVSFRLEIGENAALKKLRGTAEKYDALLEVWWDSGSEVEAIAKRPELEAAMNALRQMQAEFMSLPDSNFFFWPRTRRR